MATKTTKSKKPVPATPQLFERVRSILESARTNVARTVNTTQVVANWLIGREIVEEEQQGKRRAGYGEALLADLAERLLLEFGKGWSVRQLEYCRNFYLSYPLLLEPVKSNAVRSELPLSRLSNANSETVRRKLGESLDVLDIHHAARGESWKLTHADLGQIQFYVNYYDRERCTEGDNPTLGLILCSDKNDAVVKYTLGEQQEHNIFTSRYQLHLPTVEELENELRRELRYLVPPDVKPKRARKS